MTAIRATWLLVLSVGCSSSPAGGSTDGKAVYASTCAVCHGDRGTPTASNVARLGVKDLSDPAARARLTPAHVATQVRNGSSNKLMPAFTGALTDAQIEAVAAYVAGAGFGS